MTLVKHIILIYPSFSTTEMRFKNIEKFLCYSSLSYFRFSLEAFNVVSHSRSRSRLSPEGSILSHLRWKNSLKYASSASQSLSSSTLFCQVFFLREKAAVHGDV
jgi:hypothetical protein